MYVVISQIYLWLYVMFVIYIIFNIYSTSQPSRWWPAWQWGHWHESQHLSSHRGNLRFAAGPPEPDRRSVSDGSHWATQTSRLDSEQLEGEAPNPTIRAATEPGREDSVTMR